MYITCVGLDGKRLYRGLTYCRDGPENSVAEVNRDTCVLQKWIVTGVERGILCIRDVHRQLCVLEMCTTKL